MSLLKKFILYLPDFYFKTNCCGKCKTKIVDDLELRGVHVLSYENIMNNYTYNDSSFPEVNILYMWLTDNKYYSDDIFSHKKTELEREILFLLTGILGGQTISCNSYIRNDESFILNQDLKAGLIEESVHYQDINSSTKSIQKDENYSNNGSEILIESDNWEHLKDKIKEYFNKIDKNTIVSYNYFKTNSDLLLFTFKRFKLRLDTYNYKIDEEKTSEKSIQVRTILKNYGLSTDINHTQSFSKTHHYTIKFYKFSELKDKNNKIKYDKEMIELIKTDIFAKLRHKYEIKNEKMKKIYDDWGGDETEIYNQVIKYSKENGCYDKLKIFIDKNPGSLNGECHWFKNTIEVNQWFETHLQFIIE